MRVLFLALILFASPSMSLKASSHFEACKKTAAALANPKLRESLVKEFKARPIIVPFDPGQTLSLNHDEFFRPGVMNDVHFRTVDRELSHALKIAAGSKIIVKSPRETLSRDPLIMVAPNDLDWITSGAESMVELHESQFRLGGPKLYGFGIDPEGRAWGLIEFLEGPRAKAYLEDTEITLERRLNRFGQTLRAFDQIVERSLSELKKFPADMTLANLKVISTPEGRKLRPFDLRFVTAIPFEDMHVQDRFDLLTTLYARRTLVERLRQLGGDVSAVEIWPRFYQDFMARVDLAAETVNERGRPAYVMNAPFTDVYRWMRALRGLAPSDQTESPHPQTESH